LKYHQTGQIEVGCRAPIGLKRMRRPWIAAGILAIIAAFFFFYPLYSVLRITMVKTERVLLCAKMDEGEEFILSFIHSVNKRPVYDMIRVKGTHFLIVKSRFDSFGAGMPEGSHIVEDGWLEWPVGRFAEELSLFVGWSSNHSLRLKGREIPLARLAQAGTLLSLRIKKTSRYELWKGGCIR
jgi:hypothetical protein